MPAYIIVRLKIDAPEQLKAYQAATPSIIAKYSGRFVAQGGQVVTLEGPAETRRIVIIEFPSLADAQAFYHSPEYNAAGKLRKGIAVAEFVAVEGMD